MGRHLYNSEYIFFHFEPDFIFDCYLFASSPDQFFEDRKGEEGSIPEMANYNYIGCSGILSNQHMGLSGSVQAGDY